MINCFSIRPLLTFPLAIFVSVHFSTPLPPYSQSQNIKIPVMRSVDVFVHELTVVVIPHMYISDRYAVHLKFTVFSVNYLNKTRAEKDRNWLLFLKNNNSNASLHINNAQEAKFGSLLTW